MCVSQLFKLHECRSLPPNFCIKKLSANLFPADRSADVLLPSGITYCKPSHWKLDWANWKEELLCQRYLPVCWVYNPVWTCCIRQISERLSGRVFFCSDYAGLWGCNLDNCNSSNDSFGFSRKKGGIHGILRYDSESWLTIRSCNWFVRLQLSRLCGDILFFLCLLPFICVASTK